MTALLTFFRILQQLDMILNNRLMRRNHNNHLNQYNPTSL